MKKRHASPIHLYSRRRAFVENLLGGLAIFVVAFLIFLMMLMLF